MKTKTHIKAGSLTSNHNETLVAKPARSLKIKSGLKAGTGVIPQGPNLNHNETVVRASASNADRQSTVSRIGNPRYSRLAIGATALKIKSGLKAGTGVIPSGPVRP